MKRHGTSSWLPAVAAIPLLALAGCAEDSSVSTVSVGLHEFSISLDRTTVPAGMVRFLAENRGEDLHEFVVLRTDLSPSALPLDEAGDVDEEAEGIEVVGEVEDIEPGAEGDITLDLAPGRYVIICNLAETEPDGEVEHHFGLGMSAALLAK
ncbi:MAG: hypothetical protein HY905_02595 [Deltaproteobacteria bacterium]|nr:hypothetical protein [Deltaproteobacteria bacterium]